MLSNRASDENDENDEDSGNVSEELACGTALNDQYCPEKLP